jgi:hypothetical protein
MIKEDTYILDTTQKVAKDRVRSMKKIISKEPDDGPLRPKHSVKYTRRIEIYKNCEDGKKLIILFTIPHNKTLKYHIYDTTPTFGRY